MSKLISFLILYSTLTAAAQVFHPTNYSGTISAPTTGVSSCASLPSPLPITAAAGAITFDVTGVGMLNTTTNTLYRIDLDFNFDFGCGSYTSGQKPNQDDDLQIILVAPDGTCSVIYNADWASTSTGNFSYSLAHNQVIGLGSVGCSLQSPTGQLISTTNVNYTPNTTSNFGLFASLSDLTSTYNGVNADGKWTMLIRNTSTNRPFCISSVNTTLLFAPNELQNEIGNGGQCITAVEWNGQPTCLTTTGMPISPNLPGWNGGPDGIQTNFDNFNNGTCLWNAQNNNSIWIEFTPETADPICLSINGVDAGEAQQSIIITDPDTDGDNNPCTGSGSGSYWNVVSCPDGPIYSGTSGSDQNQMHCISPVPGQTYYLVVDGAAGASSDIFLYGVNEGAIALSVELASFNSECHTDEVELKWTVLSELNNDYFTIERSKDGLTFEPIGTISGMGTHSERLNYSFNDNRPLDGVSYYRLRQTDFDGKYTYLKMLASHCSQEQTFDIYPNPARKNEKLTFSGIEKGRYNLTVTSQIGTSVFNQEITIVNETSSIELPMESGVYIFTLQNASSKIIKRVVIY